MKATGNPILDAFAVLTESVELVARQCENLAKITAVLTHRTLPADDERDLLWNSCNLAQQKLEHIRLGLNEARMVLEVKDDSAS